MFEEREALVTGGSAGIGLALARLLLAAGARVAICGRDPTRLEAARKTLGEDVVAITADIGSEEGCRRLIEEVTQRLGGLSLLVNNAGVQGTWDPTNDASDAALAAFRDEVGVNLLGPMMLTACAWPFLASGSGAVVNVGSGLGLFPKRSAPAYCAAKAGLRAWSTALRYLAEDQGGRVRVMHAVLPPVDTAMTAGRGRGKMSPDDAATAILHGLSRWRDEVWVGKARLLPLLIRLAPGVPARLLRNA